ncbi:hypothetical protein EJF36_11540 [Bacillus sp. HMF5848]|uniref:hypothetical protein n=1 Tax=Bacillus sp. HMF5848 TaxID=2495421 RepID=UPI000F7AFE92|nr:hypothetical protein [Bacillus sp. HMF5848]RSK27466.1 hypothetical protein EJF36_11540 [Bacillus sp. HMF5848]
MPNKLSTVDYTMVKDNYLQRMLNRGTTLDAISDYIDVDYNLEEKQKAKLLKALDKEFTEMHQDNMDNIIFDVLQTLKDTPNKWAINQDGFISIVYPHPVVKGRQVVGIGYKHHKNYFFEDADLFDAYCRLQDEIEEANKPKKKRGRKPKKYSPEMLQEWIDMRQSGAKFAEIAKQYGVSVGVVNYQVNKLLKEVSRLANPLKNVKVTATENEQVAKSLRASNVQASTSRATAHKKLSNAFANLDKK